MPLKVFISALSLSLLSVSNSSLVYTCYVYLFIPLATSMFLGYGDDYPTNDFARFFTVWYILIGTVLILSLISDGITYLLNKQEQFVLHLALQDSCSNNTADKHQAAKEEFIQRSKCIVPLCITVTCVYLIIGSFFWMYEQNLTFIDALYFSIVTATTVGRAKPCIL